MDTTEIEERPHHPYSPSWLQSGEVCPNYRSRDSQHERTIAGTIAHKATETQEDDSRLSDDDAVAVAECLDFYESRRSWLAGIAEARGLKITEGTETYLKVDDIKFPDCEGTTAGYVDRWILSGEKTFAEVIDWKFGKWQVEDASNNLQGMAYTLGLFRMFPTLLAVRFWFKQPLINFLTSAVFTRADVARIYLRIQTVVARARLAREKNDYSTANPTVPNCNFCANIGKCPKVLEFACKVGKKFHPLGLPDDITPSLVTDPKNTKIAMELAAVLKVWGEAFRRQVTDRVIRGDAAMPENYVVQEMQKRQLVDLDKYKELACQYLSKQEWESCLDTTFGKVEGLISEKAPRGSKKDAVKQFQAESISSGATTLGQPFSFLKVKSGSSTTKNNS